MKVEIDLDEKILAQVDEAAAGHGVSRDDVVREYLRVGLAHGVPVIVPRVRSQDE